MLRKRIFTCFLQLLPQNAIMSAEIQRGQLLFRYDNGSVCYSYEFTEL